MANVNKNAWYRACWGASDLIGATTVTLVVNEWKEIGSVTVPADQLIGLGYGSQAGQDDAVGRIFVDLVDNTGTPVDIEGLFRIMITSSNDLPLGARPVLIEYDLATLRLGETDRAGRLPLPFTGIMLSKDKKFKFLVKNTASSAQTLELADSTAEVDITKQMV